MVLERRFRAGPHQIHDQNHYSLNLVFIPIDHPALILGKPLVEATDHPPEARRER